MHGITPAKPAMVPAKPASHDARDEPASALVAVVRAYNNEKETTPTSLQSAAVVYLQMDNPTQEPSQLYHKLDFMNSRAYFFLK